MIDLAVMDPNWSADNGGGGRGANSHYHLNGPIDIANTVRTSGMWSDDGPALVWMWATTRAVVTGQAMLLASHLGIDIVSGFVWVKVDDDIDVDMTIPHPHSWTRPPAKPGLGQWQRTEHEHLLVCRRGKLPVPLPADRQRSVIYAPRGKHSVKPEAAWRVIESTSASVVGDLQQRAKEDGHCGTEFFARTTRPMWRAFGDQL